MKTSPSLAGPSRRSIDALLLGFLGVLLTLVALAPGAIPDPRGTVVRLLLVALAYAGAVGLARRISRPAWSSTIFAAAVLGVSSFLFNESMNFQQTIHSRWFDAQVLGLERASTGIDASVTIQKFVSPSMTEWLMFTYVLYALLLPFVAYLCYRSAGPQAMSEYLLTLVSGYLVCYLGFILVPVAGPMWYQPEKYVVQLGGGFFASIGEWVRCNVHARGGSLPSPHCTAGTVMLLVLLRYNKRAAIALSPFLISIFPATIYGRFHYLSDGVLGILTAVAVTYWHPVFSRALSGHNVRLTALEAREGGAS